MLRAPLILQSTLTPQLGLAGALECIRSNYVVVQCTTQSAGLGSELLDDDVTACAAERPGRHL